MSFIINPYAFGGAAFSPDDISGLVVWLKADAITGLVDGDPVTTWEDSSSANNDATEATNKPTYKTNIINGKPVIRFDGTNDKLAIADHASLDVTNITIFAVCKVTSSGVPAYAVNRNYDGANVPYSLNLAAVGNTAMGFFNGGWRVSTITTDISSDGNFHVAAGRYDGSTLEYLLDGTLDASSAYSGSLPAGTQPLYIGTYLQDSLFFAGDIAEVIVYGSALGTTDFNNVQAYLDAKYAL